MENKTEEKQGSGGRRPDTPERKAEKKELDSMVLAIQKYMKDMMQAAMERQGFNAEVIVTKENAKDYAIRETYKQIQKKLRRAESGTPDQVEDVE